MMPAVTHPPDVDSLAAELAEAVAARPHWRVTPPPSGCSVRADYRRGDWSCVVVGDCDGWHWSAWRGLTRVRPIDGPGGASAADAVRQVEAMATSEVQP